MEKWAFIYTSGDGDAPPIEGRAGSKTCALLTVGVPTTTVPDEVIEDLVASGVELIELCGAFGPVEAGRVLEQVDGRVPVGYVTYPASEAPALHALFS